MTALTGVSYADQRDEHVAIVAASTPELGPLTAIDVLNVVRLLDFRVSAG